MCRNLSWCIDHLPNMHRNLQDMQHIWNYQSNFFTYPVSQNYIFGKFPNMYFDSVDYLFIFCSNIFCTFQICIFQICILWKGKDIIVIFNNDVISLLFSVIANTFWNRNYVFCSAPQFTKIKITATGKNVQMHMLWLYIF